MLPYKYIKNNQKETNVVCFFILYCIISRSWKIILYLDEYVLPWDNVWNMYIFAALSFLICFYFRTVILWKQLHVNIVQSAKRRVRSKVYGLTALIFKSLFSFVKILRYCTNKEFYLALCLQQFTLSKSMILLVVSRLLKWDPSVFVCCRIFACK